MKILWICKRHYTNHDLIKDRFGRIYHLPVQLKKKGWDVAVFAADYRGSETAYEELDDVGFFSFPLRLGTLKAYFQSLWRKVDEYKPDVIVASGDSHFGFIGSRAAKHANVPFVFDVYDYYPSFGTNRIPGMKCMFRNALKRADLVLCVSRNLEDYIRRYNNKVLKVINGVDREIFRPLGRGKCRSLLGIREGEDVIGYFGSIEEMRGIDCLMEACSRIVDEGNSGLRLLMCGVARDSSGWRHEWIDYRGVLPQKDVAALINASSIAVIPYKTTPQIYYANSCKIAEYISCDVPIVTTEVEDFVSNYPRQSKRLGKAVCKPGDIDSMVEAIRYQLEKQIVVTTEEPLGWDDITEVFEERLRSLK